jgi:hypothetical protein
MSTQTPSSWRERLASPLLWHFAVTAVLLATVIVLGVRFGLDWAATNSSHSDALLAKQVELRATDLQTAPLRGMDKRVEESRAHMAAFYSKRIPARYSIIAERIGDLQVNAKVRLTRVQYSQGAPGTDLTEILMDAGISGGYPEIMHFVNALERDQIFFVIRAMSLTGQQGGTVNLRLRVSTWLRPADAEASGLPTTAELDAENAAASQNGGPNASPNARKEVQ